VTRILLEAGADVNSNESGRTALAEALMAGELEVAKVLLDAGADIQQDEGAVSAAITGSVLNKRPDILRFVLDHGASARRINFDANRSSPLAIAAGSGHRELAVMLLEAGADPNELHQEYSTPLLAAIEGGNLEIVELLVARGADVNWVGHWGVTPLKLAERHRKTAIAKYLREHGASNSDSR
jgi:ankyrin repeat protein